jgi:hypothetical protein
MTNKQKRREKRLTEEKKLSKDKWKKPATPAGMVSITIRGHRLLRGLESG